MSVASNIRGILSLKKNTTVSNDPRRTALEERMALEQRIHHEAVELQQRVNQLEAVRRAVDGPKQQLAALRERKLKAEADALVNETTYDVTQINQQIAATEAEMAQLTDKSNVAARALVTLYAQLSEKQAKLTAMRGEGLRFRMQGLEVQLAEMVPEVQEALNAYKKLLIEMAALAMARDAIGPQVAGNTPIGSGGLAQLHVYAPENMKAFDGIRGTHRFDKEAEKRMREILADIGVKAA